MATINTRATFYRQDMNPLGDCIGYESGPARPSVARYQFTSPAVGATSISWKSTHCFLTNYYYDDGSGTSLAWSYSGCFNWTITTNPDTYKYYIGNNGWSGVTAMGGDGFSASATVNLLPNTTYYLWVYPNRYFSNMFAIFGIGGVIITTSGSYGISPILASNANIGSNSTLTISPYSSAFTHTVAYKVDGQSSYTAIATKTNQTSINWTVPTSVYDYLGSTSKDIGISIKCTTYSGNTSLGDSTTTLRAYAVESECKPTIQISKTWLNDSSPYTGSTETAILNWSSVRLTIQGTPKHGATIASYQIVHNGTNYNTNQQDFQKIEVNTFVYRATDSRGYASEGTLTIPVVNYTIPTINVEAKPPDVQTNISTVKAKGSYYNGNFQSGGANNTLTVEYRYKENGGSYGNWVQFSSWSNTNQNWTTPTTDLLLDYHKTYIFQCRVTDALNTIESEEVIVVALPVFDWGANDFHFNCAIILSDASYGSTLPQLGQEGQLFIKI